MEIHRILDSAKCCFNPLINPFTPQRGPFCEGKNGFSEFSQSV